MQFASFRTRSIVAGIVLTLGTAGTAGAQAWNYPTFQTPRVTTREFNFAIADGGRPAGNTFVFQWREGRNARTQLSLDAGIAETDFGPGFDDETYLLIGGQLGRQLAVSRQDMPFDVMFTGGVNAAFGEGGPFLNLPFGASVGHRFLLDGAMAITPYTHPRLAITYCGECDGGDGELDLGLALDIGLSFDVTPNVALRLAGTFGGDDDTMFADDAFGVSLAWTTGRLRR